MSSFPSDSASFLALMISAGSLKYFLALSLSFSAVLSSDLRQAPRGPRLVHIFATVRKNNGERPSPNNLKDHSLTITVSPVKSVGASFSTPISSALAIGGRSSDPATMAAAVHSLCPCNFKDLEACLCSEIKKDVQEWTKEYRIKAGNLIVR